MPVGDPPRTTEKLLDAVHSVNRLHIGDPRRLAFLRQLSDVAEPLLSSLHSNLQDVAAPPRHKESLIAKRCIALHLEMAQAYRIALECQAPRRLFRRQRQTAGDRGTYVQRALHHLCDCLKVHYLVNLTPDDAIWERIYALYSHAIQAPVDNPPDNPSESIDTLFKAAVTLHLSDPRSLRGQEVTELSAVLSDLARFARLRPAGEVPRSGPAFLIGLFSGEPPMVNPRTRCAECSKGQDCMNLDVIPMLSEIAARLSDMGRPAAAHVAAERRILKILSKRLGAARKRNGTRVNGRFDIEVIAGLADVCRHLDAPGAPGAPSEAHNPAPPAAAPKARPPISYNLVLNLEMVRIETPDYFRPTEKPKAFVPEAVQSRRAVCTSLNFSPSGYCLALKDAGSFRLQPGEFIALRDIEHDRWLPGKVSWTSSDGARLDFGVKLLAPGFLAGKAMCRVKGRTKVSACIVMHDETPSKPDRILLSRRFTSLGQPLSIEMDGKQVDTLPQRILSRTQGYVEYRCAPFIERCVSPVTEPIIDPHADEGTREASAPATDADANVDADRPWREFL